MIGFGNEYWAEAIWEDLEVFCKNNNIDFSIDRKECHDNDADGLFQHAWENRKALIEHKRKVRDLNKRIHEYNKMGGEVIKKDEYCKIKYKNVKIKLAEKGRYSIWTFLHEIGHYMQYAKNLEYSEDGADYFIVEYFQSLPGWMVFQFSESAAIFAGIKHNKFCDITGIKFWESPYYILMEKMCKESHRNNTFKFHSLLTGTII